MNARIFRSVKNAQQLARERRRMANDYDDDKWKAKCMTDATLIYLDALLWIRLSRPLNTGQHHE